MNVGPIMAQAARRGHRKRMLRQLLHSVASARSSRALRVCLAALSCFGAGDQVRALDDSSYDAARESMVREQIAARGVRDPRVIEAMRKVPRHLFVPAADRDRAYADSPVPIGEGQTISQPFLVALMTDLLAPKPGDTVLEVGTGSGYQAAVLAELVARVYTIEIVEPLGRRAMQLLEQLGYRNVEVRIGDGYNGWVEAAPFDSIIVTAAPAEIPKPLIDQLKPGGRMVIPAGESSDRQDLLLVEKQPDGTSTTRRTLPVRFVPLTRDRGAR
jgi:protein-L-isoaspartate(D-aspartate) O-methyltransferase